MMPTSYSQIQIYMFQAFFSKYESVHSYPYTDLDHIYLL